MIRSRPVVRFALVAGLGLMLGACGQMAPGNPNPVGFGWNGPIASQFALQPPPYGSALDDARTKAAKIIEQAMPQAEDLGRGGPTDPNSVDMTAGQISVDWEPAGLTETRMPPNPRASRIYLVRIELLDVLRGTGDAIAYIWFVDPANAASMNRDPSRAPSYAYRFDPAAAKLLLDLFYRRG